MTLVLLWDGLLIMAEGIGMRGRAARRFADITWVLVIALTLFYLVLLGLTLKGTL